MSGGDDTNGGDDPNGGDNTNGGDNNSGHDGDTNLDLRIDQIIADYLDAVAEGNAPAADEWLAEHPQYREELRDFLKDNLFGRGFVESVLDETSLAPTGEPQSFGEYELHEEIGRGGMGVIYKAQQQRLNRTVAVKTILTGRLATQDEVRRFQIEARSAAKLQHPNIVTIHDVGEVEGRSFYSMEYIDGKSLSDEIRDNPLSPKKAARLAKDIARAIGYAHDEGVLHRDLKPSNILIKQSGKPMITDFGLAKLMEGDSELTATGAVMGTPCYMPPEQATGQMKSVGQASDVYSIGAILYAALTTKPPHKGGTTAETVHQVVNSEVTPPRLLNPAVTEDLETICLTCLEKDPERRYATAKALADDLKRFLEGRPILAQPVSALERAWRWCRRHAAARMKLAASAWGLLIGLMVWLGLWLGPKLGMPPLDPEQPELNTVASVGALMAIWWLSEAIPLAATALLPIVLFPLLGIMSAPEVARLYGDDIIFLFLGGFLIAIAVEDSGLPRRLALNIVAALGDNPRRIVLAFMISTGLLSMWSSNTAVTIMMLPIASSLLEEVERDHRETSQPLGVALMLGIAYAASIAGTATVIGSPVNIAAVSLAEQEGLKPTFVEWMGLGLPFTITMLCATWLLLAYRLFPLGGDHFLGGKTVARRELRRLGTMKSSERRALAVFVVTAALWIFRAPQEDWGWVAALDWNAKHVSDGTVAMVMASLCFVLPAGDSGQRRLLRWESTVRLPWGVLFLFGGGLALAAGMKDVGLLRFLGHQLAGVLAAANTVGVVSALAATVAALGLAALWSQRRSTGTWDWRRARLPAASVVLGGGLLATLGAEVGPLLLTFTGMTFLTEIFTNLATVQLVTGVLVQAARELQLAAGPMIIGATLAASCAFLLPVSTMPNAVVFGSGRLTVGQMARAGVWLNLVGIALVTVVTVVVMWLAA